MCKTKKLYYKKLFKNIIFYSILQVKDIQQKINGKRRENTKLDQRVQEVNLDIAEQGLKRNMDFVEVEHKSSVERLKQKLFLFVINK